MMFRDAVGCLLMACVVGKIAELIGPDRALHALRVLANVGLVLIGGFLACATVCIAVGLTLRALRCAVRFVCDK